MKKQSAADLQQDYLDAMEVAARYLTPDSLARAAEFFSKWAAELSGHSEVEFTELTVLALLNLSRIQERLQQTDESQRTRQQAISMFDQLGGPGPRVNIEDRLAEVLIELQEYRRAIGPCEQAIKLSKGGGRKVAMRLWRAGRTYLRAGFKEHAEEPLRKALDLLRGDESDPQIPVILIDLGNALRKSNPAKAEQSYREAASIWEGQGSYEQATTAWVNLGIVCGEQERLDESLEWYEKARRVRQANATTPRPRLGSLANNIANLHRRMKNFDLAKRETEDAIELLEGDPLLADAYGTYGLILRDRGLDDASLDWFMRSRTEHARQPSPSNSALIELITNEAAALKRLGRLEEASALEQELLKLRGDVPSLQSHEIIPIPRIKPTGNEAGVVLVELDGIHLPESVYRDCDVSTLENRLEEVLEAGEQGELDGHETGPENTTVLLYGPDAEVLFGAVEPVLLEYPLCQGARVTIRQGRKERQVIIS